MEIHLIGDYAKGLDTGSIEFLLIGDQLNAKYINQLEQKIEKLIERKVQFIISNRKVYGSNIIFYFKVSFEMLKNSRILITGSTGYFIKNLLV